MSALHSLVQSIYCILDSWSSCSLSYLHSPPNFPSSVKQNHYRSIRQKEQPMQSLSRMDNISLVCLLWYWWSTCEGQMARFWAFVGIQTSWIVSRLSQCCLINRWSWWQDCVHHHCGKEETSHQWWSAIIISMTVQSLVVALRCCQTVNCELGILVNPHKRETMNEWLTYYTFIHPYIEPSHVWPYSWSLIPDPFFPSNPSLNLFFFLSSKLLSVASISPHVLCRDGFIADAMSFQTKARVM